MPAGDKPVNVQHVTCAMCLKEVPASAAVASEAVDYVAYFCGLECYEKWKSQGSGPDAEVEKPGS